MAALFRNNSNVWVMIIGLTLFLAVVAEAGRPSFGFRSHLVLQALQKGTGSAPSKNPCTYIPGSTRGRCTLEENEGDATQHFRLNAPVPAPYFPGEMGVRFATAAEDHVHHHMKNEQSSS